MRKIYFFMTFSLMAIWPIASFAVWVDNCDNKSHVVTADSFGSERHVELPPGQRHFFPGEVGTLRVGTQVVRVHDYHHQYCIWDGELSIQRRSLKGRR